MKLNIGENIKRLRKVKGLTQEQLGGLLNVSCAAVSKWESGDSYPDITMLLPLAHLFEVSVDELMGYDAARAEAQIAGVINEYNKLQSVGRHDEAVSLICKARGDFPNDYRIMHHYMWAVAGDFADNDPAVLKAHRDELSQICDCIENGCTDEHIRFEALNMKAKLLHSDGDTAGALELLQKLPSWYQCSGQRTEQLFAKDTPEFRYWVRRNLYELADFAADKAVKSVFYDDNLSYRDKVERIESIGDMLAELGEKTGEVIFTVITKSLFGRLANDLSYRGGDVGDCIRIMEKNLKAVQRLTKKARDDEVLDEVYQKSRSIYDLMQWTIDSLKSSSPLRENTEFISMLKRYSC